jgi:hypothetical protein
MNSIITTLNQFIKINFKLCLPSQQSKFDHKNNSVNITLFLKLINKNYELEKIKYCFCNDVYGPNKILRICLEANVLFKSLLFFIVTQMIFDIVISEFESLQRFH